MWRIAVEGQPKPLGASYKQYFAAIYILQI
jgi:hypothetical protein